MSSTPSSTRSILIADDEPLARERLRRLVDALPGYQVCGEAADGDAALKQVADLEPDILLLDIRMPGMDGMEAAARLGQLTNPPALVFCTAYDHYAIQAFDVQATAYLLKPVRKEALADVLERAGRVNRVQLQTLTELSTEDDEQLAVRTYRGTELIDLADILYCEADQKYVTLHHANGETVCDYTLKELENTYPRHLLRIHRHTLVGVRFVQALKRTSDGQSLVALRDGQGELPVSRRHASSVRQWLQEHQPG
ncbi:LytR/AlgR family response regulator transcription factor [Marinobacter sp. F4206]|uniref:LytR/AlgR family response regulator transcription factor n=1 Tax=Marinobacter sp. F4206 TaxID=2861777 RepID=UPI001C5D41B4|nr:LytTR family DNA-binding domain-containing protein [Marinobacter sp. F4206]MBW4935471.1 LytTR family DNA-binding domain-containing protein [Marinobacter sp. F4206]